MTEQELKLPYLNTREENVLRFLGLPTIMRAKGESTGGAYGLVEHPAVPPGFALSYHVHHREDEAFYILEGEVEFVFDGKWHIAGPGAYVFGPREVPHGFRVVGNRPAQMLILASPAGFESFVLELGEPMAAPPSPGPPDMQKLVATAAKYGIDILGPLPEKKVSRGGAIGKA